MIYLDYQATTPLAPEARAAMLPWLDKLGNPHSAHILGRAAKAAVEVAREQVAELLPPNGRIYFTSGATEAINWGINCGKGSNDSNIVTIATEHAAVLESVAAVSGAPKVTTLPVHRDGLVNLEQAKAAIIPGVALVCAMLVNNEIGVIQPIHMLAAYAHNVGARFLCDAVQGVGRVALPDVCDYIAISAHKIYGPIGIGALWVRDGAPAAAYMQGGGQEGSLRSGTLSPMLCAGFGAAAQAMTNYHERDEQRVVEQSQNLKTALGSRWLINGSTTSRYAGNLNIRLERLDASRLISELRTIAFSAGSACASGSGRPSHVLRALGLSETEARASIRIGFGRQTSDEDIKSAAIQINAAVAAQGLMI